MQKQLALALTLLPALAGTAAAVPYHFSAAACQPETPTDAATLLTNGGGVSNTNSAPFGPTITVVCPVGGLESTTQTQTELRARLWKGNPNQIGGFWQVDSNSLNTIWWSSIKFATASGGTTVRWTGSELIAGTFSGFSTYSFRALIPGRCADSTCGLSWVQSYGVTHVER